jgi:hypothetical protein
MADISYGVVMRINKDFLNDSISASNVTATMDSAGIKSDTYTLSATPTAISTANISAVGLAFVRYLATATIATCQVGVVSGTSFVSFASPRPGEPAVFRMVSGSSYQATGTNGTRLRVDVTEG